MVYSVEGELNMTIFKDKFFATDSVGINNEQLFRPHSPSTEVKII